jgi:type II secretory pathway pseudopilin PulG
MRGITLIETLIYIALFMLLIGSGVISAYYIIDSSEKNKSDVSTAAETLPYQVLMTNCLLIKSILEQL